MLQKISLTGFGIATFFVALVLIRPAMGAIVGWIFGVVFPETFGIVLGWAGLDLSPWQFGAFWGFLTGFIHGESK